MSGRVGEQSVVADESGKGPLVCLGMGMGEMSSRICRRGRGGEGWKYRYDRGNFVLGLRN